MNHNSYPLDYESENDSQPNDSYAEWQEAMKDVEFQGGKASVSTVGQEVADTLAGPEIHENLSVRWKNYLEKSKVSKIILKVSSEYKVAKN